MSESIDTGNKLFQQAVSFVNHTHRNVFLTGKAGTGKTTFLKHICTTTSKKMVVLAPTGVAAINAGGVTIHSFFHLPFGLFIPNHKTTWGGEHLRVINKNQLIAGVRIHQSKRDIIKSLELLIIDEISMVRADVLDAVDVILRSIRRNLKEPFGGVQVLLIGDLHQLPPIVKSEEIEILETYYDSPFFFSANVMQEADPLYIELEKIYRQRDDKFISLLNNVRHNCCNKEDLITLNGFYKPQFFPHKDDGYITLTTHNYKADAINQNELLKLAGKEVTLEAQIEKDFPESAYPVQKYLKLKPGAQIMFIKNEIGEQKRYYNGKIGKIEKIANDTHSITISFPGDPNPIVIERIEWKNIRYKYDSVSDKIKEEDVGVFRQFPIRLAWAITIHKSQGLTFKKAVIDAGNAFAAGQVYVALSRLTGLEGLVLKSLINEEAIQTDHKVVGFSNRKLNESFLQSELEHSQLAYIKSTFIKTFNWQDSEEKLHEFIEKYNKRSIPDIENAVKWFQHLMTQFNSIHEVAKKYHNYIQDLLNKGNTGYIELGKRTKDAAKWFKENIEDKILSSIRDHTKQMEIKSRTKKYIIEVQELYLRFNRVGHRIEKAASIAEALANNLKITDVIRHLETWNNAKADTLEAISTAQNSKLKLPTAQISLEIYKKGKSIKEIAEERNLAVSTITGHLISFIKTGEVNIDSLVAPEKQVEIKNYIQNKPKATLSEYKQLLGNDYSYEEIKAVISLMK